MTHPRESAQGYGLRRSETMSCVLLLEASTENEAELENDQSSGRALYYPLVHHSFGSESLQVCVFQLFSLDEYH